MKYRIGDFIKLPKEVPKDTENPCSPGWHKIMYLLLGQTQQITQCSHPLGCNPRYRINGWWWDESWLNQSENALNLHQRICNKIKELDNKWEKRTPKCV